MEFKKLNIEELKEIRALVDDVLWAYTKSAAKPLIRKLEFKASTLRGNISPYGSTKLSEVIRYATTASGQVKDKDHWSRILENSWSVFQREVRFTT